MKPGLILDLPLSFTNHIQLSTGPFNYASKYTCSLSSSIFTVTSFVEALEQNTVHRLSGPMEDPHTLLPTASWYQSCQGKHNMVKHWLERRFARMEKRQTKVSPVAGVRRHSLWGALAADTGQLACLRPFCRAAEGPYSLLCGVVNIQSCECVWTPLTYTLPQNSGTLLEPETGKTVLTLGCKLNTSCPGSSSLGKDVFKVLGPFLYSWVASRDCIPDSALLNTSHTFFHVDYYSKIPVLSLFSQTSHSPQIFSAQQPEWSSKNVSPIMYFPCSKSLNHFSM